MNMMQKEQDNTVNKREDQTSSGSELILFNDDIHSFDFVIEALIEVCDHEHLQAEQCALIAHYHGKCAVKSGPLEDLKPKYDEMSRRGLTVSIESV
jgi:ATP-dependent Clp protease adaptor protein ClpS